MNSASVSVAYNPNQEECVSFCEKFLIPIVARDLEELYENCDAVYIASPHYTHYEYAKSALNAGKPVLCETPFVFSKKQAEELYSIAEKKVYCFRLHSKLLIVLLSGTYSLCSNPV